MIVFFYNLNVKQRV